MSRATSRRHPVRAVPFTGRVSRAAFKAGVAVAVTLAWSELRAEPDDSGFDIELLRQRGIDPRLAEYFSATPRFTPGEHKVRLTVNGQARGFAIARIDPQGELCYDAGFRAAAGLRMPADSDAPGDCSAFIKRYALTQAQLRPDIGEVELVVPADALSEVARDLSGFSSGGTAGLLNYEWLSMANRFAGGLSRNTSVKTEMGFNAGDWIVRSHQLYSAADGVGRFQHVNAYAQRTFAGLGAILQAGQIQLTNPVLGGAQVMGLQLFNEQALAQQGGGAQVEGIALGPARVEVRQMSSLIYTTIVPGGAFVLRDVPRFNQRAALEVTVIEADGSRRQFTVSATQAGMDNFNSGYVLGVGQVQNVTDGSSPTVANAGWKGSVGRDASISVGTLASDKYLSAGAGVGYRLGTGGQVRADLVATNAAAEGVRGVQSRLSMNQSLGQHWSLSGAVTQQTQGYRELLDTRFRASDQDTLSTPRTQWSAGLGWTHEVIGGLNISYAQSTSFDGTSSSRAGASWSKTYKGATLSVTAERDLGRRGGAPDDRLATTGTALYATISMPLGSTSRLRTSYSDSNQRQRLSTSVTAAPSDTFSYRLGAERNLTDGRDGFSTGVSMLPRYAQVDLGYAGDGDQEHSVSAALRGALVVSGEGVMTSAYPLGDTFALVTVGDVPGVKIDTSSGPVWTNGSGAAVVPRLNAYTRSNVEVAPGSLPRNVDIGDGVRQVMAGRGAVERIGFNVMVTRRILLQVSDATGARLPAGAAVVDAQDAPVGVVDAQGTVFLANAINLGRLWISGPELARCELHFELPEQPDVEAYYETAPAVCRAS